MSSCYESCYSLVRHLGDSVRRGLWPQAPAHCHFANRSSTPGGGWLSTWSFAACLGSQKTETDSTTFGFFKLTLLRISISRSVALDRKTDLDFIKNNNNNNN